MKPPYGLTWREYGEAVGLSVLGHVAVYWKRVALGLLGVAVMMALFVTGRLSG